MARDDAEFDLRRPLTRQEERACSDLITAIARRYDREIRRMTARVTPTWRVVRPGWSEPVWPDAIEADIAQVLRLRNAEIEAMLDRLGWLR